MTALLFWLVVGHCLADYPLQGDFMARGKNHVTPLPGVPWVIVLLAHAMIHAGFVGAITGSLGLALAEFWLHALIDGVKSAGWLGEGEWAFTIDQALHLFCKFAYTVLVFTIGGIP